jgi:hypothetical protein
MKYYSDSNTYFESVVKQAYLGDCHANYEPERCESARLSGGRADALGYVVRLCLLLFWRDGSLLVEKLLRQTWLHLPSVYHAGEAFVLLGQKNIAANGEASRKQQFDALHVPLGESAPAANAAKRFAKPERSIRGSARKSGDSALHSVRQYIEHIRRQFFFHSTLRSGSLRRPLPISNLIRILAE